jgi:hypothetical protein
MIYKFDFDKIDQGDVFKDVEFNCESNNQYYGILLNPKCDLVIQDGKNRPKANYLKFAAIIPASFIFDNLQSNLKITKKQRSGEEYIDRGTFEDFIHLLKSFVTGNIYPRYYYIPPLLSYFSHSVIDFQLIETKKFTPEIFDSLKSCKIAELKSSWKEAVPVRYSAYSTRIGVQDYTEEFYEKMLLESSFNFRLSS